MGSVTPDDSIKMIHIPIYSDVFEQCFYVKHFGVECPTCGLTRSFYAFFNGKFRAAIAYNYLIIPSALLMIEIILYDLLALTISKGLRLISRMIVGTVIILVMMFLYRAYQMIMLILGG